MDALNKKNQMQITMELQKEQLTTNIIPSQANRAYLQKNIEIKEEAFYRKLFRWSRPR
jgi:hypothetical protein